MHRIGETNHLCRRGEACLFELSREVRYATLGKGRSEFSWVWFDGKDMPLVFRELGADHDPVFRSLDRARGETLFRELIELTKRPPPSHEFRASALLTSILADLHTGRCAERSNPSAGSEPRTFSEPIHRTMQYITRNYERPMLTVKQMAVAAAHQSLYHFWRQFHREVGVSPGRYLTQFRVEQARRLLETTARPIEEVARCVGYTDQGYFPAFSREPRGSRHERIGREVGNGRSRVRLADRRTARCRARQSIVCANSIHMVAALRCGVNRSRMCGGMAK